MIYVNGIKLNSMSYHGFVVTGHSTLGSLLPPTVLSVFVYTHVLQPLIQLRLRALNICMGYAFGVPFSLMLLSPFNILLLFLFPWDSDATSQHFRKPNRLDVSVR